MVTSEWPQHVLSSSRRAGQDLARCCPRRSAKSVRLLRQKNTSASTASSQLPAKSPEATVPPPRKPRSGAVRPQSWRPIRSNRRHRHPTGAARRLPGACPRGGGNAAGQARRRGDRSRSPASSSARVTVWRRLPPGIGGVEQLDRVMEEHGGVAGLGADDRDALSGGTGQDPHRSARIRRSPSSCPLEIQ
jgi:hypothetical protein